MAVAMMVGSALMSVVGGITQAQGAQNQAKSQAASDRYNAQVAERNAGVARGQAASQADQLAIEHRRALGTARAAFGANGLDMSGSALDVIQDAATTGALDENRALYKGDVEAIGDIDQATSYKNKAKYDLEAGQTAATSAYVGIGSSLLKGLSSPGSTDALKSIW